MSQDEILEAEIEKITGEVGAVLKVSKDHEERVIQQLGESSTGEASTSATPAGTEDLPSSITLTKDEPKDLSSSAQLATASELPTKIEDGIKEPPSTPALIEATPRTTEKSDKEMPAETAVVDSKAILDVTLPDQKSDTLVSKPDGDQNKPPSRI